MAAEVVAAGGVVLLPTESYYGLGVDPLQADGVARICAMKNRSPRAWSAGAVCRVGAVGDAGPSMPERFRIKLSRMWPAPLTVVVPSIVETAASRGGTLAVRIPAHASLRSPALPYGSADRDLRQPPRPSAVCDPGRCAGLPSRSAGARARRRSCGWRRTEHHDRFERGES